MSGIISVIIPVYKVEQYLEQCIVSVTRQTYQQLEILLVDDGSPDRCGTICDEWAKRDRRIKVIHKENGGLSDARNAGLKVASGTFIAFVDSDDFIMPTMLEQLLVALEQENAEIAECDYITFSEEVPEKGVLIRKKTVGYEMKEAMSFLLDEYKFKYTVWNKLYRREIFNCLQFEVGKIHEDVFFTYQAFGICKRVAKVEDALYCYRKRSGSIMESEISLRNLDSLEARMHQYYYIKTNFPDLSGKAQAQMLGNCLYLGQKALRCSDPAIAEKMIRQIRPLYDEGFARQTVQASKKQKMWYYIAKWNFRGCCLIRNRLRIGL